MPLEVQTVFAGAITVSEHDIFTFPRGIIGYEGATGYLIIERDQYTGLQVLQTCPSGPAFAMLDCRALTFPYTVEVELADLIELDVDRGDHLRTFVLLAHWAEKEAHSVNLSAPIIVNLSSRLGKQVVQWNSPYQTRHWLTGGTRVIPGWDLMPSAVSVTK